MPLQRETARKIYEFQIGKPIRAYQWRQLKEQLQNSNMPVNVDNIKLVAKCKSVGRRHKFNSKTLKLMVELATRLGKSAQGSQIKQCAFELKSNLTKDKFYYAFRKEGFNFRAENEYAISDLKEVLYRIFTER